MIYHLPVGVPTVLLETSVPFSWTLLSTPREHP